MRPFIQLAQHIMRVSLRGNFVNYLLEHFFGFINTAIRPNPSRKMQPEHGSVGSELYALTQQRLGACDVVIESEHAFSEHEIAARSAAASGVQLHRFPRALLGSRQRLTSSCVAE